eukprot:Gb_39611 [translate_table: standard]
MERRIETKVLPDLNNEDTVDGSSFKHGAVFEGVRFFLAGFELSLENQYATELENNGAFNVGRYDASCTHVIVQGLTYDDPICVAARKDKKTVVTDWWVADTLDMGMPANTTRVTRPSTTLGRAS